MKGNGKTRDGRNTGEVRGGRGGLFRVGYRHCFTVDENLICTVREVAPAEEEEKRIRGRERKRKRSRRRGKTLGWVLPCLSVGGGVKLNYPLVPRLPGDVCRGAGALALAPDVGGGLHRYPYSYTRTRARIHIFVRARALSSPRRRFQLKSTLGVGPDPACPARPPLLADRFDLSS